MFSGSGRIPPSCHSGHLHAARWRSLLEWRGLPKDCHSERASPRGSRRISRGSASCRNPHRCSVLRGTLRLARRHSLAQGDRGGCDAGSLVAARKAGADGRAPVTCREISNVIAHPAGETPALQFRTLILTPLRPLSLTLHCDGIILLAPQKSLGSRAERGSTGISEGGRGGGPGGDSRGGGGGGGGGD